MAKPQSRTVTLTNDEWEEIRVAADRAGFGSRGRGRWMVDRAKKENAKSERKSDG